MRAKLIETPIKILGLFISEYVHKEFYRFKDLYAQDYLFNNNKQFDLYEDRDWMLRPFFLLEIIPFKWDQTKWTNELKHDYWSFGLKILIPEGIHYTYYSSSSTDKETALEIMLQKDLDKIG